MSEDTTVDLELDLKGLLCPMPMVKVSQSIERRPGRRRHPRRGDRRRLDGRHPRVGQVHRQRARSPPRKRATSTSSSSSAPSSQGRAATDGDSSSSITLGLGGLPGHRRVHRWAWRGASTSGRPRRARLWRSACSPSPSRAPAASSSCSRTRSSHHSRRRSRRWMWLFAFIFHIAALAAFVGHLRLVQEFTPLANCSARTA